MTREWKPGDVAMVNDSTQPAAPYQKATCVDAGELGSARFVLAESGGSVWSSVTEARPLLVIDPEDREQVERLCDALLYFDMLRDGWDDGPRYRRTSDALRSLLTPKPPEPQGLGAVVRDADGLCWTNTHRMRAWLHSDKGPRKYDDIAVVEVLSEGVQP